MKPNRNMIAPRSFAVRCWCLVAADRASLKFLFFFSLSFIFFIGIAHANMCIIVCSRIFIYVYRYSHLVWHVYVCMYVFFFDTFPRLHITLSFFLSLSFALFLSHSCSHLFSIIKSRCAREHETPVHARINTYGTINIYLYTRASVGGRDAARKNRGDFPVSCVVALCRGLYRSSSATRARRSRIN